MDQTKKVLFAQKRPSRAQLRAFLEYLEETPILVSGQDRSSCAKQIRRVEWIKLSKKLNAIAGATKTASAWAKFWIDKRIYLRRITAKRAIAIREGNTLPPLLPIDKGFLRLLKNYNNPVVPLNSIYSSISPTPSPEETQHVIDHSDPAIEPFVEKEEQVYKEERLSPHSTSSSSAPVMSSPTPDVGNDPLETDSQSMNMKFEELQNFERRAFRSNKRRRRLHDDQFQSAFERLAALEERRLEVEIIKAQTHRKATVAFVQCSQAMERLAGAIRNQGKDVAESLRINGHLIAEALQTQGQLIAQALNKAV